MSLVHSSLSLSLKNLYLLAPISFPSTTTSSNPFFRIQTDSLHWTFSASRQKRWAHPVFAMCDEISVVEEVDTKEVDRSEEVENYVGESRETLLYSFTPLPLLFVAALPGAGTVRSLFGPFVELVKSLNLPDWQVHGNMAVVLFAMGGYGTYLGFRIRYSYDVEEKANAKDLHPKLLCGMFFFFALGATDGVTSLLASDRPIFESPHAITGFIGLALLTIQAIFPTLFEGNPGLRNAHGILGSGIMALFLIHAAFGLQLGLRLLATESKIHFFFVCKNYFLLVMLKILWK